MQWIKCTDGLPVIDKKKPQHFIFLNEVNHHAINIWTEFIDKFPTLITSRLMDWKWLDESTSTLSPTNVFHTPGKEKSFYDLIKFLKQDKDLKLSDGKTIDRIVWYVETYFIPPTPPVKVDEGKADEIARPTGEEIVTQILPYIDEKVKASDLQRLYKCIDSAIDKVIAGYTASQNQKQ